MDQIDYYKDKICIVTGANSGIGYALSDDLINRGATVYMAGRNPEKVAKAAELIKERVAKAAEIIQVMMPYEAERIATAPEKIHTLVVDVTKPEQVQQAIEGTAAEAGRLDMLFNNAGIHGPKLFEMTTPEDFKTITDTNPVERGLRHAHRCADHAQTGVGPHREHLVVLRACTVSG